MSKFTELTEKLREIFQIDKPELDFGVYRILNARAGEINEYLEKRLAEKVSAALASGNAANISHVRQELAETETKAKELGVNADDLPKVKELRAKIAELESGAVEHENAVFSHLLTFFSRYYESGDFISQRRYKGNTYAIPYAGEEVMLHWANKDQYYTKSGESFSNYSFKLSDGRTVHCRLIAADTAKDNRKDNDKERRFALIETMTVTRVGDDGEEWEEILIPVEELNGELTLRFAYKAMPKGTKQDALTTKAVAAILESDCVKSNWLDLTKREPTEKNPQRTLLEKHLTNYTQKNSADYFIHKNLGEFLRGELDFYIKNEVMNLDDVQNAQAFANIEKSLRMIQCLRAIALDLIVFLAQLEDFQKKLWLKKKFVVSAHYCMTLDRVPEALYPAIVANAEQWKQWHELGMRETANPGSIADLKAASALMVDTALFDAAFQISLLKSIPNLDATTDGLLVHGDNFQALTLLKEKFRSKVNTIYIDPPYNTDASAIDYKNGYKSSSWVALLESRLKAARPMLVDNGVLMAAIDDAQYKELSFICNESFDGNTLGTFAVRANPSGRPTKTGYSISHEYMIAVGQSEKSSIGRLPPTDAQRSRFNQSDNDGPFEWRNLRREGSNSDRSKRKNLYYPIYIKDKSLRVPKMEWSDSDDKWRILENPMEGEQVVYPDNDEGQQKTWRWEGSTVTASMNKLAIRPDRSGKDYVYYKRRPNDDGVVSVSTWADAKYSATEHGTALLKALFKVPAFAYPKSIHAVVDAIFIAGAANRNAVVMDFFAGSGTTSHAVIELNRSDDGKRKYLLAEQGDYFDTVIKPRIQKVVYSAEWRDGMPTSDDTGISHAIKILRIEGYEDSLNNLELIRNPNQSDLLNAMLDKAKEDYLLKYMLDVESRGSLLSVESFKKPFDFKLKVAVDSAGASEARNVDLVETFNYLIGLTVKTIDADIERGFVTVVGRLPSGDRTLVLWRDCEKIGYEELTKLCDKLAVNPADNEYDVVYVNGDHNIPSVLTSTEDEGGITRTLKLRQIEPEFLSAMFDVDDV